MSAASTCITVKLHVTFRRESLHLTLHLLSYVMSLHGFRDHFRCS
ncbi:rCG22772, partial [Rattus norvegicus]